MTDIAELRVKIDSGQVRESNKQLEELDRRGQQAEKTVTRLTESSEKSSRGFRKFRGEVSDARQPIDWMTGSMANLSFQLNDIASGVAMGQSPFQILAQQGGQVFQVFQMQPGLFGQLARSVGAFALSAKGAASGIAGAFVLAGMALSNFVDQQNEVQRSLNGIGRASGATMQDVNDAAKQSATSFGLSVSSARALAATLVSTGSIGRQSLAPLLTIITGMNQKLGIDGADAAKLLGDSLKSPTAGFDKLNDVLGIGGDRLRETVRWMELSGQKQQAQAVLIKATDAALGNMVKTQSFWSVMSTGAVNIVSNAWDGLGSKMSDMTGAGRSLEKEIELQKSRISETVPWAKLLGERYEKMVTDQALKKLDEYEQKLIRIRGQQEESATAQTSVRFGDIVRSGNPEIELRKTIQANIDYVDSKRKVLEANGQLAQSEKEISDALNNFRDALNGVRSADQSAILADQAAIAALKARSPAELAAAAAIRTRIQLGGEAKTVFNTQEKNDRVATASALARAQAEQQLKDAARDRMLASKDAIGSSSIDLQVIGKSVGETERLRANWQSYADLRREAERNNLPIDMAQLKRLEAQNEQMARLKQLVAESNLRADVNFDTSQIFRSDTDQQIASRLRSVYGDNYTQYMDSAIAGQMRLNSALRESKDLATDFATSYAHDVANGVSKTDALNNSLRNLGLRLIDLTIQRSVNSIFGGVGSLFGGGGVTAGTAGGTNPFNTGSAGARYDSGGYTGPGGRYEPAGIVHRGEYVFDQPAVNRIGLGNLSRLHRGYADGGYVSGGGSQVQVNVINQSGRQMQARETGRRQSGNKVVIDVLLEAVAGSIASGQGPINSSLEGRYGLDPTKGMSS